MKIRQLALVILFAMFVATAVCGSAKQVAQYSATLSGAKEVPSVDTKAKGEATFTLSRDAASIKYTITVSDLQNPTAAHIHSGGPGKNGPVVVLLYSTSEPAVRKNKAYTKDNVLVNGVITSSNLIGPLKGKRLVDLLKAIKLGNIYVNVHTKAHPDGEIRGWVIEKPKK